MTFYGNGVVWDGKNNRPLCRFEDGKIDTTDDTICQRLTALNYLCALDDDGKAPSIPDSVTTVSPKAKSIKSPQRKAVKK